MSVNRRVAQLVNQVFTPVFSSALGGGSLPTVGDLWGLAPETSRRPSPLLAKGSRPPLGDPHPDMRVAREHARVEVPCELSNGLVRQWASPPVW
jgi:hypothetical protein